VAVLTHLLDPSHAQNGSFWISFTYDASTGTGKTTAHTYSYHGRFLTLVMDRQVVEVS
jgi:hypothetical protein